jgi:hypothetical protein
MIVRRLSSVVHRLSLVAIVGLLATAAAWACPNCKDGIANGPNASIGDAYSMSVVFMLAVPTVILTVATIVIAKKLKQVE